MFEATERIWAFQSDGGRRGWLHTKPPQAIIDIPVEYVRADLLDALTEERDRLKQWQADQVEVNEEAKALITELNADKKALEAERDRLALANAELLAGLDEYDQTANAIGSCGDGYCLVERPKGMHTNGGCRCAFDRFKAQRMMMAGQRLRNVLDKHKATSTERESE